MSTEQIADIGRRLAFALKDRGHTRSAEDTKRVAALQTELVREVLIEAEQSNGTGQAAPWEPCSTSTE